MIISRTPFRISFFGGGTDYAPWYRKHGGMVLATTINKYCYITVRYLPPFFEHRFRLVYSKIESCTDVDQISHPSVREVLKYLDYHRGTEIHHDGDLPARSGMGSSSAFTVGFLNAIYALRGFMASKQQLAREATYIEQVRIGETVGAQDQAMAAHGGFNVIHFNTCGAVNVMPVPISAERLQDLNSHLMLFYTGIKRTASNIAETIVQDMDSKAKEANLRALKDMVQEGLSILNSSQELAGFGRLLHEAWQIKSSLSAKVANSEIDSIYAKAMQAGALGGKLLGAGGGGFFLIFAHQSAHSKIKETLSHLLHVPFKFDFTGSQIIFCDRDVEDYAALDKMRQTQIIRPFQELTSMPAESAPPELAPKSET